jgi:radical SAM protein with 4Fe4S-binding SPASM domain
LRCKWCYAKSSGYEKGEVITIGTVRNIMSIVGPLPHRVLVLIGGEPTLHPDFLPIISEIKKYESIYLGVVSNGTLLKDLSFLKQSILNGVDGFTISLKAPNSYLYENFTEVSSAFDDVSRGIENLNSVNQRYRLSITINNELIKHLDEVVYFINHHNIKTVYVDSERPIIINDKAIFEGDSIYDNNNFYNIIFDKFKQLQIKYTIKISIPFCRIDNKLINAMKDARVIQSGCHIFSKSGLIFDTKGNMLICNSLCEYPMGKLGIDFNTTEEMLSFRNSPGVNTLYSKLQSYPDIKCSKCKQWVLCGGGCRIHWLYKNMLKGGSENESTRIN